MPEQAYKTLNLEVLDRVALVTLNRADKANAMNADMWQDIEHCFDSLDRDPQVRSIVLAGQGKHFSAGIDLAMFGAITEELQHFETARRAEAMAAKISRLQANLTALERCRKPVLAAVHGSCLGGALALVACCDMRYCAEGAQFSVKEIDIGMVADVGTLQRLPHIMSEGLVRELAYTGRNLTAHEALASGLVNAIYSTREQLIEEVVGIARQIASKSPLAVRGTKNALLYARDHAVSDGLQQVAVWNGGMMSQQDMLTAAALRSGQKTEFDN